MRGAAATIAVSALALLAWPAAAQDLPIIARGTLTDPSGQPTAGNIRVYVNEAMVSTGSRGRMKPLAEVDAGPDGQWVARGALNPAARRAISQGDGQVNLLILARTAAGDVLLPAPRQLGGEAVASAASGPSPDTNIDVSVPAEAAQAAPAPAASAASTSRADCEWVATPSRIRNTRIGELHQSKLVSAKFEYAAEHHADTDFSGALSYSSGHGPWTARGGYHVSTRRGTTDTFSPPRGKFSRYLISRFSYRTLYLKGKDCGRKEYLVMPVKFRGGSDWKGYNDAAEILDGACSRVSPEYNHPIAPGSSFSTAHAKAVDISVGVSIFGASLSTQSGYSNQVVGQWTTSKRAKKTQYVCGNGQDPVDAPVVYAG
jgi:hypothetical protein